MLKFLRLLFILILSSSVSKAGPFYEAIQDFESGKMEKALPVFAQHAIEHDNLLAREYVYWCHKNGKTVLTEEARPLIGERDEDPRDLSFCTKWVKASFIYQKLASDDYPNSKKGRQRKNGDKSYLPTLGPRGLYLSGSRNYMQQLACGNIFVLLDENFQRTCMLTATSAPVSNGNAHCLDESDRYLDEMPHRLLKSYVAGEQFHDEKRLGFIKTVEIRTIHLSRVATGWNKEVIFREVLGIPGMVEFLAMCGNFMAKKYYTSHLLAFKNKDISAPWVDHLVSLGDVPSMYNAGYNIFYGMGYEKDEEKGFGLIQKAAKAQNTYAQLFLVDYYYQKKENESCREYAQAIIDTPYATPDEKGSAYLKLGMLHFYKNIDGSSDKQAYDYFQMAKEHGNEVVYYHEAVMHFMGKGPDDQPSGPERAREILLERNGDLDAHSHYLMGHILIFHSTSEEIDYEQAYMHFSKASESIEDANLIMGEMLYHKLVKGGTFDQALEKFNKAQKYPTAKFYTGYIYYTGASSFGQNKKLGLRLIKEAATMGHESAIYFLAHLNRTPDEELSAHRSSSTESDSSSGDESEMTIDLTSDEDEEEPVEGEPENEEISELEREINQGIEEKNKEIEELRAKKRKTQIEYTLTTKNKKWRPPSFQGERFSADKSTYALSSSTYSFFQAVFGREKISSFKMEDAIKAFTELGSRMSEISVQTPKASDNSTKIQFVHKGNGNKHTLKLHNPHGQGNNLYMALNKYMKAFLGSVGLGLENFVLQ